MPPCLARITIFPIKSCDGLEVDEAPLLISGALAHDRRFALVDAAGRFWNAKRTPRIHQLRSRFDLRAGTVTLTLLGAQQTFRLDAEQQALAAWLSDFFELPLRLEENSAAGFPDDTAAPGPTLISTATLETVAGWFPGLSVDEVRRRFRANLEIAGVEPFWEDRLYAAAGQSVIFQVGPVRLAGTNPCQRCVVPTRSPDTGDRYPDFAAIFERRRRETLPDWADQSRFDHFYRLAVNTKPVGAGAGTLRVGDPVRIGN